MAGMDAHEVPTRFRIAVHRVVGCYVARTPTLPGCACRGATAVEAIENVRAAIRAYLVTAQALAGETVVVELEISA
jgi:predicted RNase H-like HicB family nuclease